MPLRTALAILLLFAAMTPAVAQQSAGADVKTAIGRLANLNYTVRTDAARAVRRVPAPEAVPALTEAVRSHPDEYVRYRALVLLTGFNDPKTGDLMRTLLRDKNDRLREIAYRWLAQHPDPLMTLGLLEALGTEQAEFVRPALVRALAALGADPQVQRTLIAEIGRGFDFFRIAVIEALGQAKARYAVAAIAEAGRQDGPLQDDAVLALGRIGDAKALAALTAIAGTRVDVAMAAHAAKCLTGDDCPSHIKALADALTARGAGPDVIRAAAGGLAALAAESDAGLTALVDAAVDATADVHGAVAVALGGVAVRTPERVVAAVQSAPADRAALVTDLLREGFDRLEEDLGEEQFFASVRAAYWKAPDGSPTRTLMATLIQKLDF